MEHQKNLSRTHSASHDQDDWDEVHKQLLAVQKKSDRGNESGDTRLINNFNSNIEIQPEIRKKEKNSLTDLLQKAKDHKCSPADVINALETEHQTNLGWFTQLIGFITTTLKPLAKNQLWVWTDCFVPEARGRAVRNAEWSTDGFWTIDVELESMIVQSISKKEIPGFEDAVYNKKSGRRYIRLEIKPDTRAHDVCEKIDGRLDGRRMFKSGRIFNPKSIKLKKGTSIKFGGVLLIDHGPHLEVHPEDNFSIE
ncbi:MAG TPA: hypothetical protein VFJ43_12040 [Bacteroidia bacterium]|nr:hypothetical protein [Bacteroidia bacterium]